MILERVEVKRFRRVRDAVLDLGAGLNVIHGPNDLGKSTIAEAIRAALLLRSTAKDAESFVPWDDPDAQPMVRLTFRDDEGTRWRVRKRFGRSGGAGALLERWEDEEWRSVAKGRHVDGTLRERLRWGIPVPGGRGGPRGIPDTFLARALLGEQGRSTALFEASVDEDPSSSGREWLEETVASYARDEAFDAVLEKARAEVARAFLSNGNRSMAAGTPFRQARDEVQRRVQAEREALRALEAAEATHEALAAARRTLTETEAGRARAAERLEHAKARAHQRALAELDEAIAVATEAEAARQAKAAERRDAEASREEALARLQRLRSEAATLERRIAAARAAAAAESVADARAVHAQATKRATAAAERSRLVATATLLAEERALKAQRRELAERADEAADLRRRAKERESEAEALDAPSGPDPEAMAAVAEAEQALEVARARVSVGLRLALDVADDVEVSVVVDGGDEQGGENLVQAKGRARVVLRRAGAPLATIDAQAGDDADHQALEGARSAFRAELDPLLDTHGAEDLAALRTLAAEAQERGARAKGRRAEAQRLRERAAELAVGDRLEALDRTLGDLADRIDRREDGAALLEEEGALEVLTAEAEDGEGAAARALREAEAGVARAEATLDAAEDALAEEQDAAPGDLEALGAELEATRTAIAETEPKTRALPEATAAEADAHALAELRARRATLTENAPPGPAPEPGKPCPTPEEAADALAAAEGSVRGAREAIARLEGRADQQPLAEASARLERARSAAERARAAEREVELEYGGYQRLVATLEATASERGRDLGAALVEPVSDRFAALLQAVGGETERYGSLVLASDASTEGAIVDGEVRGLDALSMGTREQLAMLLRLTLAERLRSFLLLDDHLTHTDRERAAVLGALHREVAERTQLIVFTCHPERYLDGEADDRVRAIDAGPLLRPDGER